MPGNREPNWTVGSHKSQSPKAQRRNKQGRRKETYNFGQAAAKWQTLNFTTINFNTDLHLLRYSKNLRIVKKVGLRSGQFEFFFCTLLLHVT